jgi:superfamily II DNA or RNA helicase
LFSIDGASSSGTESASPHPARRGSGGLRAWQRDALARFEASASPNFLAVATPGAGKTTFALTAARRALLARAIRRVVVVVPTQHLKFQWAHAAERLDIHLDPEWNLGYGGLPPDAHGVAVTYQQVAASPAALRPVVRGALAILDEIHHAGDSRAWGDATRQAFDSAWRRLSLSGTPFRSDQRAIPFINYNGDLAEADYEYGYGDALKDGRVVRPVYFPRINGRMEWTAPDGVEYEATFDDRLARDLASQRLRTALAVEGEWMPAVLAQAHAQLMHLRARDPHAAGLVITMDQEHAKAIAGVLEGRLGVTPTIATSDDPSASEKISRFASGIAPWIVAVRMVSEGVDIPRLRVGVYATNTVTELFFRQAVGRLVRWNAHLGRQAAYMFIPDDVRLRKFGGAIAEQRRHCLRKESRDDEEGARQDGAEPPPKKTETERDLAEQLSLFAPISATALDEQGRPIEIDGPRLYDASADDDPNGAIPDLAGAPGGAEERHDGARVPLDLTPLGGQVPPPVADAVPLAAAKNGMLARRRQLREQNAEAVIDLVHLTGRTHPEINAELNRKIGVKRISIATLRQLERRLELARAMLRGR